MCFFLLIQHKVSAHGRVSHIQGKSPYLILTSGILSQTHPYAYLLDDVESGQVDSNQAPPSTTHILPHLPPQLPYEMGQHKLRNSNGLAQDPIVPNVRNGMKAPSLGFCWMSHSTIILVVLERDNLRITLLLMFIHGAKIPNLKQQQGIKATS